MNVYRVALQIVYPGASNAVGVANALTNVCSYLAHRIPLGNARLYKHPAVVLIMSQLNHLLTSSSELADPDYWEYCYKVCERRADYPKPSIFLVCYNSGHATLRVIRGKTTREYTLTLASYARLLRLEKRGYLRNVTNGIDNKSGYLRWIVTPTKDWRIS